MKEAMPICVMYIPYDYSFYSGGIMATPNDLMASLNGYDKNVKPQGHLGGYLWLVFLKDGIEAPELQYINTQGVEPMQYEEIIKLIKANDTCGTVNTEPNPTNK